jgi:hypothetical protein
VAHRVKQRGCPLLLAFQPKLVEVRVV